MKKLAFIIVILCFTGICAHAQRKIEYSFDIGGGLAIQGVNNPNILSNSAIRTFNADAFVDLPVLKQYYVRAGLTFAQKGTMITEDALTTTNKITYYEIPVQFVRKFNAPSLGKIIGGLGGYFAMGDRGTLTYETPNSQNSDYVAFGPENDFLKYDAGITITTGLQLDNHLTFNLGYDLGLSNIASQTLKDTGTKSIYNREFSISLGVIF